METTANPFNDFVFLHATPSDRGSFTLATEKALAKLEKFQLPDPKLFILQWIQALVASGAENISMAYEESTIQNKFVMAQPVRCNIPSIHELSCLISELVNLTQEQLNK